MPGRHTKSPVSYSYTKSTPRPAYFQFYSTISELELKNTISSLCLKSLIIQKSGPLLPVRGEGGYEHTRRTPSLPYGPGVKLGIQAAY